MGFVLASPKCLPLQTSYLEWFISLSGDSWGLMPAGEFFGRLQGCAKIAQGYMYTCMCIYVYLAPHLANGKRKKPSFKVCKGLRINISTSLSTLGVAFLDSSVTEAFIAFVLNPGSCTAESGHAVSLDRFPKRECSSSWHTGALTPHQWSLGLQYFFFYLTRSTHSVDSELSRWLLKIQMLIHQCWKYKNSDSHMSVQISSPFPRWKCRCCAVFPESAHWIQERHILGLCKPKYLWKCLVCALTRHPCACLSILAESISVWAAGQVSKRAERKPATWEKCNLRAKD